MCSSSGTSFPIRVTLMNAKAGFRPFRIKGGDKQVQKYIKDLRAQIVRAAHPQKIILFGSYAYGQPTADSDVDLLVIMPFEVSPHRQAVNIRLQIESPVALDLLVRTPEYVAQRLAWGDFFMNEVVKQGKVIYETDHARVDQQSRRRLGERAT